VPGICCQRRSWNAAGLSLATSTFAPVWLVRSRLLLLAARAISKTRFVGDLGDHAQAGDSGVEIYEWGSTVAMWSPSRIPLLRGGARLQHDRTHRAGVKGRRTARLASFIRGARSKPAINSSTIHSGVLSRFSTAP